jgi:hypothetical protein
MKWVKVKDPDGVFYHYEITAKGGNDMEDLEKRIEEWEEYKRELKRKIANTPDEQKRNFLKKRLTIAIKTLERLRNQQWREL